MSGALRSAKEVEHLENLAAALKALPGGPTEDTEEASARLAELAMATDDPHELRRLVGAMRSFPAGRAATP